MRFLSILCLTLISCQAPTTTIQETNQGSTPPALASQRPAIDETQIQNVLSLLASDTTGGRDPKTPAFENSARAVEKELTSLGLNPTRQTFTSTEGSSFNIFATLYGTSAKTILIGAHLDHLALRDGQIMNGADDNASGVAAVLSAARALAPLQGKISSSIIFAFFSIEERGLKGSTAYVESLPSKDSISYAINLDMVGRSKGKLLAWGLGSSPEGKQAFERALLLHSSLAVTYDDKITNNSDHWPFYARGVPIGMFHTGVHADYHKATDDVERIDFPGLTELTSLLVDFVLALDEVSRFTYEILPSAGLHLFDDEGFLGCAHPSF